VGTIANFLENVSVKELKKLGQYVVKIWTRVRCVVSFTPGVFIRLASVIISIRHTTDNDSKNLRIARITQRTFFDGQFYKTKHRKACTAVSYLTVHCI